MKRRIIVQLSAVISMIVLFVLSQNMLDKSSAYAQNSMLTGEQQKFMQTVMRALLDEAAKKDITVGVLGFVDLTTHPLQIKDKLPEADYTNAVLLAGDAADSIEEQLISIKKGSDSGNRISFIGPGKLWQVMVDNKIELERVMLYETNKDIVDTAVTGIGRHAGLDAIIEIIVYVTEQGPERVAAKIIRVKDSKVANVIEMGIEENYRIRLRDGQLEAALRNARLCLEAYYSDNNNKYPDSLSSDCIRRLIPTYVTVTYKKRSDDKYTLFGSHLKGHKIFSLSSDGRLITEEKK